MSTLRTYGPFLIPLLVLALIVKRIADMGSDIGKVTGTPERLKRGTAGKPKKKKK